MPQPCPCPSFLLSVLVFLTGVPAAVASDLVLVPETATLDGPRAFQRFLVLNRVDGTFAGDETAAATFTIDDPAVARVDDQGRVTPVGDGETNLHVLASGRSISARIVVKNAQRAEPISFNREVMPILTRAGCNMGACHGSAAGKNGLRLTLRGFGPEMDYDALTRQALGRRIVKTAPTESLMLLKATGAVEHGGGVRFAVDSPEYRLLVDWIADGLPPPSAEEPAVTKVEVLPRTWRAEPGRLQQLLVQATYADGRVRDVTRLARFESTDMNVAKVDESGQVTVTGHGEGAIAVGFSSLVDLASVVSPYPDPIAPRLFAGAPRQNRIDEINLQKLESLNIPPSPPADDATFLRRAYLDATGTLPTLEAVETFLADSDPDKRSKLIDRLLESPEFVDYWAYKWSDLLLISTKQLSGPTMWAFYRFVRESVERNLPWDEFARQIITARGSTLNNGAANYFVLHRDTIDLTESTSMAFLGLSLTCARCHNHPLEKWTQDQYYGMANLFSRVSLKDGEAGRGEVIVAASPEGEIDHPRRGEPVAPQPLDGQALGLDERGDRRVAFAAWLQEPSNPYFDRALVNRVWANFFGRGIIDPEDDLRATNPPSDSDLIEWLVADFRANGRDVKHLIRTIMASAAYQRSSDPTPEHEGDPKYLSRYPVKRLAAEVLLDAISQVTEAPTSFPGYPTGWRSLQLPDARVANSFLDSFGRPVRESVCSCERSDEPSVSQALHLTNGSTLNDKLRADAGVVARLAASDLPEEAIIDHLMRSALSRPPTDAERATVTPLLAEAVSGIEDPQERVVARRQAIEDLYWAILTGKEFLFVR